MLSRYIALEPTSNVPVRFQDYVKKACWQRAIWNSQLSRIFVVSNSDDFQTRAYRARLKFKIDLISDSRRFSLCYLSKIHELKLGRSVIPINNGTDHLLPENVGDHAAVNTFFVAVVVTIDSVPNSVVLLLDIVDRHFIVTWLPS